MHKIIKHRPGGVEALGIFTELNTFYIDSVSGLSKISSIKIQKKYKITTDGIVGSNTRAKLKGLVK